MKLTKNSFSYIEDQIQKMPAKYAPVVLFTFVIAGKSIDIPVTLN